jgi:hypothetical protein
MATERKVVGRSVDGHVGCVTVDKKIFLLTRGEAPDSQLAKRLGMPTQRDRSLDLDFLID